MAIHKNNNDNNDNEEGEPFDDDFGKRIERGFREAMEQGKKRDKVMHEIGAKANADGRADVAEAMHVLVDEINRSNDLNIAAMIPLTKTFEAVFQAFRGEADASVVHEDDGRRFMMECGIVCADEGRFHCAPGGIHLHDLQIVAGIAAMRSFLFARLRKIQTAMPIIEEMVKEDQLEAAAGRLDEAMRSVSSMMAMLNKLGFSLLDSHPVAIKAKEGAKQAEAMMHKIHDRIAKRDAGK